MPRSSASGLLITTSSEQISEMQTKYDTEKKEVENSLLLAEKELDKAALDKQTTQQNATIRLVFGTRYCGLHCLQLKPKEKDEQVIKYSE